MEKQISIEGRGHLVAELIVHSINEATICIDDNANSAFWAEIPITRDDLQRWTEAMDNGPN